jgi:hypothetical protein
MKNTKAYVKSNTLRISFHSYAFLLRLHPSFLLREHPCLTSLNLSIRRRDKRREKVSIF